jgi:ABC-type multidrug transport system fused ATPase/permease subunit
MKLIWGTLRDLLPLLPVGARRFFFWYMLVTSLITVLDVAALGLLALVIGPALSGAKLSLPVIGVLPATATPIIVLVACLLIILKSALSAFFQWVATRRFASYELEIGNRLFRAYIHSSWEERAKRTVPEITRIADAGIANTIMGFILPLSILPSTIVSFVLILGVLLIANPMTSLIALVYLSLVALIVNKVVTRRALEASQVNRDFSYRVAILMTEMVDALKELSLRNRLDQVAGVVTKNRVHAVRARANTSFLGTIPLYSF